MSGTQQDKISHHFVPVTYLKRFTDDDGLVFAYRLDDPSHALHLSPPSIGYRNRYYSQPTPDGEYDHNTIEDGLAEFADRLWTPIVDCIHQQHHLEPAAMIDLFQFVGALHVRVPCIRDSVELALANDVMRQFHTMDAAGSFPPKPPELERVIDQLGASIDPHQSLHAMPMAAMEFGKIADSLGLQVLQIATEIPLITSDNPVIFFDPAVDEDEMLPYRVTPGDGQIEMFIPLDPWHVIHGHTELKAEFVKRGIKYAQISNAQETERINRLIARFAYQFAFASSTQSEETIRAFADTSPVPDDKASAHAGAKGVQNTEFIMSNMVFGPRRRKLKWSPGDVHNSGEAAAG